MPHLHRVPHWGKFLLGTVVGKIKVCDYDEGFFVRAFHVTILASIAPLKVIWGPILWHSRSTISSLEKSTSGGVTGYRGISLFSGVLASGEQKTGYLTTVEVLPLLVFDLGDFILGECGGRTPASSICVKL